MKILCLSDLHLRPDETDDFLISGILSTEMSKVRKIFQKSNSDVVVLTGDTVCQHQLRYLDKICSTMFDMETPIIVCLGNHEIWGGTVEDAKSLLKNQKIKSSNVFHLDLGESYMTSKAQFIGGMLFFDGSMRFQEDQKLTPWNGWQDWRISKVEDYESICHDYISQFKSQIKPGKSIVLCTHHLPHEKLNGHEPSIYSFYSGVKDITSEMVFDRSKEHWFICGHTHRRVIMDPLPGFHGVNVGSDYGKILSYSFSI